MEDQCSVDGCEKSRYILGMCSAHYQKARYHGTLPPPPKRACAHCAEEFTARKWGAIYCSRKCGDNARRAREKSQKGRRAEVCEHCGSVLADRRPNARFCSVKCGQEFRNAALAADILRAKADRPPCRGCGGLVSASKSGKAEFCSADCRIKARRHEKYSLTREELAAMLEQRSVCAICGTSNWGKKGPCVDHCHKTGAVRGILCGRCNTGLGQFGDDPKRLLAAVAYLRENGRQDV